MLVSRVVVSYASKELAKVPQLERQVEAHNNDLRHINGELHDMKESSQRIERTLGRLTADVAYLKGRFARHDEWERGQKQDNDEGG